SAREGGPRRSVRQRRRGHGAAPGVRRRKGRVHHGSARYRSSPRQSLSLMLDFLRQYWAYLLGALLLHVLFAGLFGLTMIQLSRNAPEPQLAIQAVVVDQSMLGNSSRERERAREQERLRQQREKELAAEREKQLAEQ